MSQIKVEVPEGPVVKTKRFTGRQLVRYEMRDNLRAVTFRVYLTAKGQYAVHTRNDPDWARLSSADENNPAREDPRTRGAGNGAVTSPNGDARAGVACGNDCVAWS